MINTIPQAAAASLLTHHRWKLGTCVPQNILGKTGYLTRCQVNIERLSLQTDGACNINMKSKDSYDLAKFNQIRALSWIGLRSNTDFQALRACFIANAKHLEILKLETSEWLEQFNRWKGFTNDEDPNYDYFAQETLGLNTKSSGMDSVLFPALQNLHLGNFYLSEMCGDFAGALNMFRLKRLSLWNCLGSGQLLKHIVAQDLQLVSLELMCGSSNEDAEDLEIQLGPILRKHTGLQDLFLYLGIIEWRDVIDAIFMHLTTLKRVVLHAQGTNFELGPYYHQEEDQALDSHANIYDLFTNGVCEMIAISNPPHVLVGKISSHLAEKLC